jgi:hypothetical protein
MDEKISCRRCGAMILPATAAQTGGVCMRCKSGMAELLFVDLKSYPKGLWAYVFHKSPRSVVGHALKGAFLAGAIYVMLSIALIAGASISLPSPAWGGAFFFQNMSAVPAGVALQFVLEPLFGGWRGDGPVVLCAAITWLMGGSIVGVVYGFRMKKHGWKKDEPAPTRYVHRDY